MTAALLPLPDDPRLEWLIESWPRLSSGPGAWQRSQWLGAFEQFLRKAHPTANSDSLTLTARHYAPFPLRDGPNVP